MTAAEFLEWVKAIGLPSAVAGFLLFERLKSPKQHPTDINAALVQELNGIRLEVKEVRVEFGRMRERMAAVEAIQDERK